VKSTTANPTSTIHLLFQLPNKHQPRYRQVAAISHILNNEFPDDFEDFFSTLANEMLQDFNVKSTTTNPALGYSSIITPTL